MQNYFQKYFMQYDMILKNADSILKNDDANILFLS